MDSAKRLTNRHNIRRNIRGFLARNDLATRRSRAVYKPVARRIERRVHRDISLEMALCRGQGGLVAVKWIGLAVFASDGFAVCVEARYTALRDVVDDGLTYTPAAVAVRGRGLNLAHVGALG
jgi:hypothetical protein